MVCIFSFHQIRNKLKLLNENLIKYGVLPSWNCASAATFFLEFSIMYDCHFAFYRLWLK